jgi:hypothetical protein
MAMEDNIKSEEQTTSLEDLELANQQAEETKAGTGTHGAGGGQGAGKATFQDLSFSTR